MNGIITYTSLTINDILNLTYVQFKNIVDGIKTEVNWNTKLAMLSNYGYDGSKLIKDEDHPLYTKKNIENKVMRMEDANALTSMNKV